MNAFSRFQRVTISAMLGLSACTGEKPAATLPAPTPPPTPSLPALSGNPSAPPPPPTAATGATTLAGAPPAAAHAATAAAPPVSNVALEDDEGMPLTDAVQIIQRAIETYEEKRSDDEQKPWPELTDLSQLIKYRVLNRLPPAPAGKKFVFDSRTKQVSLASR